MSDHEVNRGAGSGPTCEEWLKAQTDQEAGQLASPDLIVGPNAALRMQGTTQRS
jgi:hypothetical protein